MRWFVIGSVTIVATLLQGGELSAQQVSAVPFEWRADGPSAFMRVYGPAQAPLGFSRFCEANPEDCRADSDTNARLAASPQRLNELDEINRRVNRLIIPATDLAHYGVAELWALPTDGKGDCEHKSRVLTMTRSETGSGAGQGNEVFLATSRACRYGQ